MPHIHRPATVDAYEMQRVLIPNKTLLYKLIIRLSHHQSTIKDVNKCGVFLRGTGNNLQ